MLTIDMLTPDQQNAIDRVYDYDETLLYAKMGAGKSVIYLTGVNYLLQNGHINRVLIVAPLKPAQQVWAHEHSKWEHLQHLSVALATGTPEQREKAIASDAKIVVINIENLAWFIDKYGKNHGFDALCIDELSKFGSVGNKSVKKLRHKINTFKHRVGLTGTPVHEGFDKLFSQVMMLDGGRHLGTNKQRFLRKYFYPTDYNEYNWELKSGSAESLTRLLSGLVYAVPDYTHELPPLVESVMPVVLDDDVMRQYDKFKRDYMISLDGVDIVAENAAVLSGKLAQFANGFVYDEDKTPHAVHSKKISTCSEFIAGLSGQLLLFYQYQEDKKQLGELLTKLGIAWSCLDDKQAIDKFLAQDIDVLLLNPLSAGHGLNLQLSGCHQILCYSPIWSHDQYKQLVSRVWRRGQTYPVTVWQLATVGTIDEIKLDRVASKAEYEQAFTRHIAPGRKQ